MAGSYKNIIGNKTYIFKNLKELMAKASTQKSGDILAGISASNEEERVIAQMTLCDVMLKDFLEDLLIPYEDDEITRLIIDEHDVIKFKKISSLSVGDFRNFLLEEETNSLVLKSLQNAITPEMAAAVSKIMRNQDLILCAKKCEIITSFRNTLGLSGQLSTRLQANHPKDDLKAIAAGVFDGLLNANGDALIGINPASDNVNENIEVLKLLDEIIYTYNIPTQACVLSHITNTIKAIEKNAPVDIVFQSIGGTQDTNSSFGINIKLIKEAQEAALSLKRGTIGTNVMYFETGQGSALSSHTHHNIDQQTCETRAYALAKKFDPLLVNTVVGFIGPEYLYDGKQIIRAALEDHFCAKLLGLPMGCDICYTNHALADQNDMDVLLTLLGVANCNFIMGVPGNDDIMLNYQSTSFNDALYLRQVLKLKPAKEFEKWLYEMNIYDKNSSNILTNNMPKKLKESFQKLIGLS